jgi:hypothetical protein
MDATRLDRELTAHFTRAVAALSQYGEVYAAKEPLELGEAVRAACDSENEYDRYVDNGFRDLPLDELLVLDWDFGAQALLEVLRLQSHFIVFDDEPFGARIFAALPVLEGVLEPFVESFFGTNGTEYGAPLMDEIPSDTVNRRSDLISKQALRCAYREYLDWTTAHDYSGWDTMFADEEVPGLEELDEEDQGDSTSFSEKEKEILLDEYFRRFYTARRSGRRSYKAR